MSPPRLEFDPRFPGAPARLTAAADSEPRPAASGGVEADHGTLLSEALAAVVSQALVPTKDGKSRVAAHEIMVCNAAVRNLIREGKVAQLASLLPTQKEAGNQTLAQSLKKLVEDGVISVAAARRAWRRRRVVAPLPSNVAKPSSQRPDGVRPASVPRLH